MGVPLVRLKMGSPGPWAPGTFSFLSGLEAIRLLHVASLFLVVRPGAPSSVLAPSSKAR